MTFVSAGSVALEYQLNWFGALGSRERTHRWAVEVGVGVGENSGRDGVDAAGA